VTWFALQVLLGYLKIIKAKQKTWLLVWLHYWSVSHEIFKHAVNLITIEGVVYNLLLCNFYENTCVIFRIHSTHKFYHLWKEIKTNNLNFQITFSFIYYILIETMNTFFSIKFFYMIHNLTCGICYANSSHKFKMFSNHLSEKEKEYVVVPVLPYHINTLLTVLAAARDINCRTKLAGNWSNCCWDSAGSWNLHV
jgi:hypothetical protein